MYTWMPTHTRNTAGTKDYLLPYVGGDVDVKSVHIPTHAAKMALMAGPVVSVVETSAALVTETITTVRAHI